MELSTSDQQGSGPLLHCLTQGSGLVDWTILWQLHQGSCGITDWLSIASYQKSHSISANTSLAKICHVTPSTDEDTIRTFPPLLLKETAGLKWVVNETCHATDASEDIQPVNHKTVIGEWNSCLTLSNIKTPMSSYKRFDKHKWILRIHSNQHGWPLTVRQVMVMSNWRGGVLPIIYLYIKKNGQAGSAKQFFFRCCVKLLVGANCFHGLKMSCVPTTSDKGLEGSGLAGHLPLCRIYLGLPCSRAPSRQ